MNPSVGRIVHYTHLTHYDENAEHYVRYHVMAALITSVNTHNNTVSLHIFAETYQFDRRACLFTEAKAGTEEAHGMWSWPERV